MSMSSQNHAAPTAIIAPIWQALSEHKAKLEKLHLKDLFAQDTENSQNNQRFSTFSLTAAELFLDYSKQRVLPETIDLLCQLATHANVAAKRDEMFAGAIMNPTEQRAVLHTALRDLSAQPVIVDGENVKPLIHDVMQRLTTCVTAIRTKAWRGYSGKPIKAIVNIGIGGSDLGPAMAAAALTPYTARELEYYFVSNIDGTHISEVLRCVDPATTLFIVASKTFTTQETLTNALTAKDWLLNSAMANANNGTNANVNANATINVNTNNSNLRASGADDVIKHHFIAVTAKPERAVAFGIAAANVYPFWDWVGGRYSLWSAIGISLAIAIGMENFRTLLAGAYAMDEHFKSAPYQQNMPVLLALLGIWNINFWDSATHAVIPYDQYLHLLPFYLQQLEMESNGKRVHLDGTPVQHATAPIIWGSVGTNGQHAFHQLLMQGTQTVPVDFIVAANSHNPIGNHHMLLVANCLAQSQALMCGRDNIAAQSPHKVILGDVPSNTIVLPQLTPYTLGALLALYEHKTFVQGIIWHINSFDQWGVELGKQLANTIVSELSAFNATTATAAIGAEKSLTAKPNSERPTLDSSTQGLMQRLHDLHRHA